VHRNVHTYMSNFRCRRIPRDGLERSGRERDREGRGDVGGRGQGKARAESCVFAVERKRGNSHPKSEPAAKELMDAFLWYLLASLKKGAFMGVPPKNRP
jgi:hypothetical protein